MIIKAFMFEKDLQALKDGKTRMPQIFTEKHDARVFDTGTSPLLEVEIRTEPDV